MLSHGNSIDSYAQRNWQCLRHRAVLYRGAFGGNNFAHLPTQVIVPITLRGRLLARRISNHGHSVYHKHPLISQTLPWQQFCSLADSVQKTIAASNAERSIRMAGKVDQAKGRVKEAAGALTGNQRLKQEGKMDQAAGKVKSAATKTVDAVKNAVAGKK